VSPPGQGRFAARPRRLTRWALLSLLTAALALSAMGASAQRPVTPQAPVKIEISAKPIVSFEARDSGRRQFGGLEFRGGLELTSAQQDFGGISGIRMERDGARFLAVTDKGNWLRGRIVYQGDAPADIADAEMAPMLGADGRPLAARGWYDAESLADDGAGTIFVGIERVHQIVKFDYGKLGLLARGTPIPVPSDMKRMPSNKGIEGLVFVPKGMPLAGSLIAISERALDGAGNTRGWLIGGPSPGDFAIKRSDDFDVGDATLTPAGDLILVERHFSWLRGVAMRIRRISLASVKPGALLDGPVLITADYGFQIDNMEGIAVHRSAAGETVLTLVSDDNFSALQRTILLQFTLLEP
jgi:hypothetical protein